MEDHYVAQEELDEIIYWVWLAQLRGLCLAEKHFLLAAVGEAKTIFFAKQDGIEAVLNKTVAVQLDFSLCYCELALVWMQQSPNHHLLPIASDDYPAMLRQIPDPPILLYVMGCVGCLQEPQVGIVGSRRQTPAGQKMATTLATDLAQAGLTITSGLALGIDASAHWACLRAGGFTVAVLGHGLNQIYPHSHIDLANEVAASGCLISEFVLDMPPKRQNFPRRNRLIAGLSHGLIVVEAAMRSGSLITARFALEQGKDVFAVPGSPLSAQACGCNALIKQGAILLDSSDDVLNELSVVLKDQLLASKSGVNSVSKIDEKSSPVLKWVSYEPISLDEIIALSGLTSSEVSSMLLGMELAGVIVRLKSGLYSRV